MKYCTACEDMFDPKVSKIAKHCSADCLYEKTGKSIEQCAWCGDDFDKSFTKTFVGCCEGCDNEVGMMILQKLSKRFAQEHDSYALILVSQKIREVAGETLDRIS